MSRIDETILGLLLKKQGIVKSCKECGAPAEYFCNRAPGSDEACCNGTFCDKHVRKVRGQENVHRCRTCDFENWTPP